MREAQQKFLHSPMEFPCGYSRCAVYIVRQLRTIFSLDVDTADNSVNFFPHVSHCLKFPFLIGANHEINYSCPYLVFKMAALLSTITTGSG